MKSVVRKLSVASALGIALLGVGIPSALASSSPEITSGGISALASCHLYANTPFVSGGALYGDVGRTGCSNTVSWVEGYLSRDLPGQNDQVLASATRSNANEVAFRLQSWPTRGHDYLTWIKSSTGAWASSGILYYR